MTAVLPSQENLFKLERSFVLLLIAAFPVLMGTVGSAASAIFLLLSLAGIPLLFREWSKLQSWEKGILYGFSSLRRASAGQRVYVGRPRSGLATL